MRFHSLFLFGSLLVAGLAGCGNATNKTDHMVGEFISLKDALPALGDEDLINIAYRNNHDHLYSDDFKEVDASSYPIHSVGDLDEKRADTVLLDYFLFKKDDPYFAEIGLRKDEVTINVYCGQYKGYEAIQFNRPRNQCLAQKWYQNFNGWLLEYPCQGELWLWRPSGANVN